MKVGSGLGLMELIIDEYVIRLGFREAGMTQYKLPGTHLNIKTLFPRYEDSHV